MEVARLIDQKKRLDKKSFFLLGPRATGQSGIRFMPMNDPTPEVPDPAGRAQVCFYREIQVWTGELDATLAEPADPQNKAPRGRKKFSDPVRHSSAKLQKRQISRFSATHELETGGQIH